jgi:hypothetical protein
LSLPAKAVFMELKEIQAALPENVLNAIGVLADFGFDVFTSAKLEDVTDLKTRRAAGHMVAFGSV